MVLFIDEDTRATHDHAQEFKNALLTLSQSDGIYVSGRYIDTPELCFLGTSVQSFVRMFGGWSDPSHRRFVAGALLVSKVRASLQRKDFLCTPAPTPRA